MLKLLLIFFSSLFFCYSYAAELSLNDFLDSTWRLNSAQQAYLKKGEILADTNVETIGKDQTFSAKGMAMHKKKCTKVLRKLSKLENFKDWISFFTRSDYNEESKLFTLRADHFLLPYPMIIFIIVDRPTKPGKYHFTFPTGIFTGLKGFFEIKEINKRCIVYTESFWRGKKTKLPDLVIELFTEALSKKAGEILMRKSN